MHVSVKELASARDCAEGKKKVSSEIRKEIFISPFFYFKQLKSFSFWR